MNVIRPVSGLLAASFLSACASVDIQEYQADETTKQGASGLPYYMPRPYIVAVLLPADGTGTGSTVPTVQAQPNRQAPVMPANPPAHNPAPPPNVVAPTPRAGGVPVHASAPAPAPAAQPAPATDSSQTAKAAAPSSGATETQDGGLQFSNSRYLLRIIQLQDYSRPVRINVRPGLFGTARSPRS
jgi:cytoskeletal protein RodZ